MKPTDEEPFEAWLRGDDELSRAYRDGAQEQPPAGVDADVLAQARRAVRRRRARWPQPLAVAATVVLGVALLFAVQQQQSRQQAASVAADVALEQPQQPTAHTQQPARKQVQPLALPSVRQGPELLQYRALDPAPPAPAAAQSESESAPAGAASAITAPAANDAETPTSPPGRQRPDVPRSRGLTASPRAAAPMAEATRQSAAAATDAGTWLAGIRRLLETGQREAAVAQLRAYRQRYPEQILPTDLQRLLQE